MSATYIRVIGNLIICWGMCSVQPVFKNFDGLM